MRFSHSTRLIMLGATLSTTVVLAGDDLFSQAYRPYTRTATADPQPATTTMPTASFPTAALPTEVAPGISPVMPAAPISAVAAAASNATVTARRSRLTWLKGGRGPAVGVEPAILPATTPPPAPTVAAMFSAPAAAPDYVPPASKGLVGRMFRSNVPEVPPGLPRGAAPVAMVPPEPVVSTPASPLMTRIDPLPAAEPRLAGNYADPATSRSSYAASPRSGADVYPRTSETMGSRPINQSSMLEPARPRTVEPALVRPRPVAPARVGVGVADVPFAVARPGRDLANDAEANRPAPSLLDDLTPARPSNR